MLCCMSAERGRSASPLGARRCNSSPLSRRITQRRRCRKRRRMSFRCHGVAPYVLPCASCAYVKPADVSYAADVETPAQASGLFWADDFALLRHAALKSRSWCCSHLRRVPEGTQGRPLTDGPSKAPLVTHLTRLIGEHSTWISSMDAPGLASRGLCGRSLRLPPPLVAFLPSFQLD